MCMEQNAEVAHIIILPDIPHFQHMWPDVYYEAHHRQHHIGGYVLGRQKSVMIQHFSKCLRSILACIWQQCDVPAL